MSAPPAHVHASVRPTVQRWRSRFQPLPFLALLNNLVGLGAIQKGTSWKDLPVVEHALAEGFASGVGLEVSCEPEGLVDEQVGLDNEPGVPGLWASSNTRPLLDILADETSFVELNPAIKAWSWSLSILFILTSFLSF